MKGLWLTTIHSWNLSKHLKPCEVFLPLYRRSSLETAGSNSPADYVDSAALTSTLWIRAIRKTSAMRGSASRESDQGRCIRISDLEVGRRQNALERTYGRAPEKSFMFSDIFKTGNVGRFEGGRLQLCAGQLVHYEWLKIRTS